LLDRFADPRIKREKLAQKINDCFLQAKNNGTGTLGELDENPKDNTQCVTKHPADYVFANVPFYVNGVTQIDDSLSALGVYSFYDGCGIGVESRFVKYILGQIKNGNPGIAFVIVTDGILYRHKDKIRDVININADMIGIISLPEGTFQNNNWKTSILIFKRKTDMPEFAPVFIYNINHIGISLDSYRTPTEENDIPDLKRAWQKRYSGQIDDPKCKLIPRDEFLKTKRWSDLFFDWRQVDTSSNISFPEFIENATAINTDISRILKDADKSLSDIFAYDDFIEVQLGDEKYFNTNTPKFKTTVKHARLHPGKYPLFSSQVDKAVEHMEDNNNPPILIYNEKKGEKKKLISWNIKGDPCKDIRVHEEPFYSTENRGLIEIKNNKIDFYFLLYYLREHLVSLGNFKRSDEAHAGKVKNIFIRVPSDSKGNIDTSKQKEIARDYEKILVLRKNVTDRIVELQGLISNIDVFK